MERKDNVASPRQWRENGLRWDKKWKKEDRRGGEYKEEKNKVCWNHSLALLRICDTD